MNFYPFHIGDYAAHTRHLSLMEDLAYRRLIDLYYLSEGSIVGNAELIARRIGMSEISSDVKYILETYFEQNGENWINKRCDEELAKYRLKAESARNANRIKSEKISALKSTLKSEPNQTLTNNQEPITNNIKTITPVGVSESIFKDFKKLRASKKAPITETALKGLEREAKKANMSLQSVMELCCERGWSGFKADWVIKDEEKSKELPLGNDQQIEAAYRAECGDPAKSRFNNYWEMKNFVIAQREKRKLAV